MLLSRKTHLLISRIQLPGSNSHLFNKKIIMKKRSRKLILLAVLFTTISASVSAQVFVKVRPPAPVIVRTQQPDPLYVWVNEDWEPAGSSYRYSGGHWAPPPQPGYQHRSGHWVKTSKGQKWVKGSWYKKRPGNKVHHYGKYKGKQKGNHKGKYKRRH